MSSSLMINMTTQPLPATATATDEACRFAESVLDCLDHQDYARMRTIVCSHHVGDIERFAGSAVFHWAMALGNHWVIRVQQSNSRSGAKVSQPLSLQYNHFLSLAQTLKLAQEQSPREAELIGQLKMANRRLATNT